MVLRRFGLKTVIDFVHFGLESGIVFEGATVVYEHFVDWFQMNKKQERSYNGYQCRLLEDYIEKRGGD